MHSFTKGASRYLYNELHKKGIIIRSTISLSRLPVKYIGVIWIIDIDFKSIKENRYRLLLDEIRYGDIVNRYSVFGNIGGQVGSIVFLPLFEDGELNKIADGIKEELPGNVIKTLVVTDVLTGALCYRRFDNTYSRAYRLLVGLKKIEPVKLISMQEAIFNGLLQTLRRCTSSTVLHDHSGVFPIGAVVPGEEEFLDAPSCAFKQFSHLIPGYIKVVEPISRILHEPDPQF